MPFYMMFICEQPHSSICSIDEQMKIMWEINYSLNISMISFCPTSDAGISAVIK